MLPALLVLGLNAPASADYEIVYGRNTADGSIANSGSITYNGTGGPLVGTNIQYDTITGVETPANQGSTLAITGGKLNFTTGNFASSTSTTWTFAAGGTITITGAVPSLGINSASTVLLSGYFNIDTVVTKQNLAAKILNAGIFDYKNAAVEQYFGITNGPLSWTGNLDANFSAAGSPPGGFSSTKIFGSSIQNTAATPEPSSLAIAGLGVLGMIGYGLRRRRGA